MLQNVNYISNITKKDVYGKHIVSYIFSLNWLNNVFHLHTKGSL